MFSASVQHWNVQVLRPVDTIFRGPGVALAESPQTGARLSCMGGSPILDHMCTVE